MKSPSFGRSVLSVDLSLGEQGVFRPCALLHDMA
jgi:hypothetical protein